MILLGDRAQGRDNNLNLIRAVAATAVLVSHAYPIALGDGTAEPLLDLTGFSLGSISVAAFFVISGFLIAQSFERSSSRTGFVMARFLRLWPGLIVCTVLVALLLGPVVTRLPLASYLAAPDTWAFILRDITLISVQYHLPGVFEDLPYTAVVGSIWTLLYEVLCYIGLFVLGVLGILARPVLTTVLLGALAALFMWMTQTDPDWHPKLINAIRLALPFGIGTCFYLWRDRIVLNIWALAGLVALTVALRVTGPKAIYVPVFTLALAYAVFWLAYVPDGLIRQFNRLGDYSYGIYIYAFPLQGFVVWAFGAMSPGLNMALSLPLTLICAVLSWHLVEQPFMARRKDYTTWVLRRLGHV